MTKQHLQVRAAVAVRVLSLIEDGARPPRLTALSVELPIIRKLPIHWPFTGPRKVRILYVGGRVR